MEKEKENRCKKGTRRYKPFGKDCYPIGEINADIEKKKTQKNKGVLSKKEESKKQVLSKEEESKKKEESKEEESKKPVLSKEEKEVLSEKDVLKE